MTETIRTPDGRTVTFCQWGDRQGFPVFSLHGTPGSRLSRHPDEEVYRRAGVRAITYDRPGYGGSSRHPGRSVADAPADVAAIADALGLTRFAVTGGSGGAPHALACGALLPERVIRCASVVGPTPVNDGGLPAEEWVDGMVEGNVREFGWAMQGEEVLRPNSERVAAELLQSIQGDAQNPLGEDFALSPEDLDVIGRSGIRTMLAAAMREGIGRSVDGFVDDDLAFVKPWGFEPSQITVPVTVAYGPHDTLVPRRHGEWLAETIPGARRVVLGGGHFAVYDELPALLAWLVGEAGVSS